MNFAFGLRKGAFILLASGKWAMGVPLFFTPNHLICVMALNQTNKLAWIVRTISDAGKITFEELSRRWAENESLSGGEPLLKRTFHKWKNSILDTFGLVIECEKTAPYRYMILPDFNTGA